MNGFLTFLTEWGHLTGLTVALLLLQSFAGFATTIGTLPRFYRVRWILAAPLVGTAVHSVLLTPLCVGGFTVRQVWWIPTMLALAANIAVLTRLRATDKGKKLLRAMALASKRAAGTFFLAVTLVTLASTFLITSRNTGSTRDLWGSSDFFDYWSMADYVQKYGANLTAYQAQDEYKSRDVERHLTNGARLGAITNLAAWARVLSPDNTYCLVNAAIVGSMATWILLLGLFLDRERVRARWPLLLASAHPFLYCLLYFSYYSQATCVPVCILSLMLLENWIQSARRGRSFSSQVVTAGVILGSNLLSYAALAVPIALFACISAVRLLASRISFNRSVAVLLPPYAVAVLCSFYYLPHPWRELTYVNAQAVQGGWEWKGLVGFPELFGFSSVLGYFLPSSEFVERVCLNSVLGAIAVVLLLYAWRTLRQRLTVITLLTSTLMLFGIAINKVLASVPNATHGVFKIVSQYGLLFFVVLLLPVHALFQRSRSRRWLPVASLVALTAWLWQEWQTINVGADQRFLFKPAAVQFLREQAKDGRKICVLIDRFGWWCENIFEAILKRPEGFVMRASEPLVEPSSIQPLAFVYSADVGDPAITYAHSGIYRLGTPPAELDFRAAGQHMWIQNGAPLLSPVDKRFEHCIVVMGPRQPRLAVRYRWVGASGSQSAIPLGMKLSAYLNDQPCGEHEISSKEGELIVQVPAASATEHYTIVRLEIDKKAPLAPGGVIIEKLTYRPADDSALVHY